MRLLLIAILAAGCSKSDPGRSLFVTKCGVTLKGDVWPDGWNADEFQANEDRLVERFASVKDYRFKTACERMDSTTLWVQPEYWWVDEVGRKVTGLTSCTRRQIQVGWMYDVRLTSMGHEYAHVVQNCEPPAPIDRGEDASHANWRRDGIYFAAGVGVP